MKNLNSSKQCIFGLFTLAFLILIILSSLAAAAPGQTVIANSADWSDVYSTMLYANLLEITGYFLTSTPHGPILLYEIPQDTEIQVITSADKPFVVGYDTLIRSKGYPNPQEIVIDSANLELARRLTNITKFIILDQSYGYNALAAAPYAARAKYYVLFADDRNIDDISDFLAGKRVDDIIIFGPVDREVKTALAQYNPEILNSETGSRFENNMLIVDKYAEIGSIKQVILSNGEFIEASMMSGNEPILFIGKNNVPDEIKNYIQSKGVEIGVLIGNELIGSATTIRRQLGISVFVKFARGSRIPGGTINPVEDLDRFPMPSYQLSLSITSISYNRATGMLEVTYVNNVDLATYFKSTITIKNGDGSILAVVGDNDTAFIDGGETKTMNYILKNPLSNEDLAGNITADIFTIYGESKTSLEQALRGTFKIETIDIMDNTDIEIIEVVYDKTSGKFLVTIENTGAVDAYVSVELIDLWINDGYVTVASDSVEKIGPGKRKVIAISIALDDEDLASPKNAKIHVRANFGERKYALVKSKEQDFELKTKTGFTWWYIPVIIIILILIILFFILFWKRKRCPRCRTMNRRSARHCKKCKYEFGSRDYHDHHDKR